MTITLNQLKNALQGVLHKLNRKAENPDLNETNPNSLAYVKGSKEVARKDAVLPKDKTIPDELIPDDIPRLVNGKIPEANIPDEAFETELPSVTTADNGKVLQVVSGKWEKASLPDGDEVAY